MPDLSLEGVHAFWHEYDKKTLYRIVTSMESVEAWATDNSPRVDELLVKLGEVLDSTDVDEITNEDQLVKLLGNIRLSRALRIMQYLDVLIPGTASKFLVYAEENTKDKDADEKNKYADLFLKRNLIFERLQLIGRIFSQERINLVLKAMESSTD